MTTSTLTNTYLDFSDVTDTVARLTVDKSSVKLSGAGNTNLVLSGIASPVAANDATNKSYIDGLSLGSQLKSAVRVASTANIDLDKVIPKVIDSVTLTGGDRILLKNQTNPLQNGVYIFSDKPVRSADMAVNSNAGGIFMFVCEGTTQASTGWLACPAIVGKDNISFIKFTSGIPYTANSNISISPTNVISVTDNITLPAGTITALSGSKLGKITFQDAKMTADGNVPINFGTLVAASGSQIGSLTLADGAITDAGGTINFSNNKLVTTGRISANSYLTLSDERLKENVVEIKDALAKVSALRGVYFNWKSNGCADVGVIAQEVESVMPDCVHQESDGYKRVDYGRLTCLLIQAINEIADKL
jgi:hypothetical protein